MMPMDDDDDDDGEADNDDDFPLLSVALGIFKVQQGLNQVGAKDYRFPFIKMIL